MDKNLLRSPWLRYLKAALSIGNGAEQCFAERARADDAPAAQKPMLLRRIARSAPQFISGSRGDPAKSILITSPASGDGKTTLASNLAIAIAQTGRRVLLIDADCWHPAQSAIFEMQDGPGLTEILEGAAVLKDVVQKTQTANTRSSALRKDPGKSC